MNDQSPTIEDNTFAAQPPATFGLRALAKLVDLLVLNVLQLMLFCAVAVPDALGSLSKGLGIALLATYLLLSVGYFAFFSSRGRQTWGYRLAGIRVLMEDGQAVGGWRSSGRAVLDFLALMTVQYVIGLLDYLPIAMTRSKRAGHDRLTRTVVARIAPPHHTALAFGSVASVIAPFLIVFGIVRPFMLQAFYIVSPSMAPTLQANDRFLVNKLSYRLYPIRHEDIIIFAAPAKVMAGHPDFPKRVAGLPGDVIRTIRGRVVINGQEYNHAVVRDCLGTAGLFGPSAMSAGYVNIGEHHVKFISNGVLADGQFVPKTRLALLLTGSAQSHVTVLPGYMLRNSKRIAEPFLAEDPDYDLRFSQGHALVHRYQTERLGDAYERDQQSITKAEYDRDAALPDDHVPTGQLVVFGDNRNDSRDSAEWGYLPETTVEGKATLMFLPQWRRLR